MSAARDDEFYGIGRHAVTGGARTTHIHTHSARLNHPIQTTGRRASPERPPAGHRGRQDERRPTACAKQQPPFHDGWQRPTRNPLRVLTTHKHARTDRAPRRVFFLAGRLRPAEFID